MVECVLGTELKSVGWCRKVKDCEVPSKWQWWHRSQGLRPKPSFTAFTLKAVTRSFVFCKKKGFLSENYCVIMQMGEPTDLYLEHWETLSLGSESLAYDNVGASQPCSNQLVGNISPAGRNRGYHQACLVWSSTLQSQKMSGSLSLAPGVWKKVPGYWENSQHQKPQSWATILHLRKTNCSTAREPYCVLSKD